MSGNPSQKATELGFIGNLPNASDRYLKNIASTESLGEAVGSKSEVLVQANLPNITLKGKTDNSTHSHNYNERGVGSIYSIERGSTKTIIDDTKVAERTTDGAGGHTHNYTVNSGGKNYPLTVEPKYLLTYIFVYLGN